MATYMELFNAKNNSDLQDKITVAVVIAAEAIRVDVSPPANHVQRLLWAQIAMSDPVTEARKMLWAVLAVNKDITLSQILDATDVTIQAQVDAVVDLFAGS